MENSDLESIVFLLGEVREMFRHFAQAKSGSHIAESAQLMSRAFFDFYYLASKANEELELLRARVALEKPAAQPSHSDELASVKFAIIRGAIRNDKEDRLTHGAILTLFALLDHAQAKGRKLVIEEVPQGILADEINRHRGSVYRGIEVLEQLGIIVRVVQGSGGQTTVYEIDIPGEGP